MSSIQRRRVRPVYAARVVSERARDLGLGAIEERVTESILAGRKSQRVPPGLPPLREGESLVFVDSDTVVKIVRRPSPVNPSRRAHFVVRMWRRRRGDVWAA